ncbi:MAG: hypothetical protein ACJ8KU_02190 [Chthoniobacterales bacterium]
MRITNAKHVPWLIFVVLATAGACWLYVGNFYPERLSPAMQLPDTLRQTPSDHRSVGGTPLGLWFGAIALAIFLFAALLSLRKKLPLWRMGTVQRWLRAHIWLTLLTIPLVILHSGFRLGGPMTALLVALYSVVMVSGIYGLMLQHRLPTLMKERLPAEPVFQQLPNIRAQLYSSAEKMRDALRLAAPQLDSARNGAQPDRRSRTAYSAPAARVEREVAAESLAAASIGSTEAEIGGASVKFHEEDKPQRGSSLELGGELPSELVLAEFVDRHVLPYLRSKRGRRFRLGDAGLAQETFRQMRLRVAEPYRGRVDELESWCDERRLIDLQVRLQQWLHGWLFVHVPTSFLLIILTFWHAYVTLFYY